MRSTLPHLAIVSFLVYVTATEAVAQSSGRKSIHAFVAADEQRKPRTIFSADVPRIYAFWKGQSLAVGDSIRAVWIAEDVGAASPKDTKIRDAEVQVFKADENGVVSLSRPAGQNWPLGTYRVEFYLNGSISEVVKFTIGAGVQVETH